VSRIDSGWRLCGQVEVLGIVAVMDNGEVQDRASRILRSPADKAKVSKTDSTIGSGLTWG